MVILEIFKDKIRSKIYTKTHQIAPFFFNFLGGACPRTPIANRKKILPPPPAKSWLRP